MNDLTVKRTNISRYPLFKPLFVGFLGGIFVCFIILLIAAFLMTLKDIPEWSLGIISAVASALGSLVGGYIGAYMFKKRGLFVGALLGVIIFGVIFLIGCFCGADPFTVGKLAMIVANNTLGSVGGIIGINKVIKRKF